MKYHWHVVYRWWKDSGNDGMGSIEMTLDDDLFVPSDIRGLIMKYKDFDECVIINWKKLDQNQLCEGLTSKTL